MMVQWGGGGGNAVKEESPGCDSRNIYTSWGLGKASRMELHLSREM